MNSLNLMASTPSDELNPGIRIGNFWYWPELDLELPYISGGDGESTEDEDADEDADDNEDDGEDEGDKDRKFSQKKMQEIAAREKRQGKKAGAKEVLEKLGVKDISEAEEIIAAYRKLQEESQDASTRAKNEADAAKAEADRIRAEAAQERFEAKLERRLEAAGLKVDTKDEEKREKQLAKAMRLLDLEPDADAEDIKVAISDLKSELPGLFVSDGDDEDDEDAKPRKRGTADSTPPKPKGKGKPDPQAAAKARLARLHPNIVKS